VWAANEPFVGEWKVNPAKSKLTDLMKVESVAGNRYAFELGGGSAETIATDGTDQPGLAGTTLAVTVEGPDSWKVVRKQAGRILLTAYWKLSKDGNTLTDDFTQFGADGSSTTVKLVFDRTAGTSGFAGTWERNGATLDSAYVIKVQPYEDGGLSFVNASQGVTRNVTFDGRDHPLVGPNALPGSTSSARRVTERTLEITTRIGANVASTQEDTLSSDGKTLTMTVHAAGRTAPSIFVFERQ
jgi:hypothetical protein